MVWRDGQFHSLLKYPDRDWRTPPEVCNALSLPVLSPNENSFQVKRNNNILVLTKKHCVWRETQQRGGNVPFAFPAFLLVSASSPVLYSVKARGPFLIVSYKTNLISPQKVVPAFRHHRESDPFAERFYFCPPALPCFFTPYEEMYSPGLPQHSSVIPPFDSGEVRWLKVTFHCQSAKSLSQDVSDPPVIP